LVWKQHMGIEEMGGPRKSEKPGGTFWVS